MKSFYGKLMIFLKGEPSAEALLKLRNKALHSNYIFSHFCKMMFSRKMVKFGAFVPFSATLGNGIVFPHNFYGIFISSGAKIGENCVIFHQVTIGSNTIKNSKNNGAPTIGNNVYIGAGAKIIGGVHIGNNVRIGANCVVTKDIPDNATVVSAPIRIIEHEHTQDNQFTPYNAK